MRLVSNDSNDTAHCGLGVFSTSPRMDPGDVFGSPDGEFASASVPAKSNRSSRCSFCHRALARRPDAVPHVFRVVVLRRGVPRRRRRARKIRVRNRDVGVLVVRPALGDAPGERCLAANASDARATARLHRRWADFGADARARLAVTAAVASHCATRRREHLAARVEPGRRPGSDVRGARERVRGEVAVARRRPLLSARSAKRRGFRLASLRAALVTMSQKPTPKPRAVPRRVVRSERGSRDGGARDVSGDVAAEPLVRSERAR